LGEKRERNKKMKFIFLVGVEGTGHHMIRAILKGHFEKLGFIDEGLYHDVLLNRWDVNRRFNRENRLIRIFKNDNCRKRLDNIFNRYLSQNATHLFESASFPYFNPRDTLRRPDIIDFMELTDGLPIDVRFLILYRDPVAATYSAYRRKISNNIFEQTKIVEDNLIYIERQFSQINEDDYRILIFENFIKDAERYSKALSAWWGLDEQILISDLNNLHEPNHLVKASKEELEKIDNHFSSKRIKQWSSFFSRNILSKV
tara:strand:+ start:308 stop:1081 length:774 start_codon:yes stop_codon:yes gene_type:complete